MAIGLKTIVTLDKADRYTNPAVENTVLPLVYGDHTENTGNQGVWEAPCIDTVNHVFCIAGHPVLSEANGNSFSIYVNGMLQTSGYTVDPANNYESEGSIAIVTFTADPEGTVQVACMGKASGLNLIATPTGILEDLISRSGNAVLPDATAWARAETFEVSENYSAAGVILSDNELGFWFNALAATFFANYWITETGRLLWQYNADTQAVQVYGILRQEIATVTMSQDAVNLCNQAKVNYAPSFVKSDRRFKENVNTQYVMIDDGESTANSSSQALYDVREREFQMDWTRNTATVNSLQTYITDTYGDPLWLYEWQEAAWEHAHLTKGDYVAFTYRGRLDDDGDPIEMQIAQIQRIAKDFDNFTVSFTLRELPGEQHGV